MPFTVNLFSAAFNKFVVAEPNGQANCNRDNAGPWEAFTVVTVGNDQFAFRGAHGKFLVAENDGDKTVNANRDNRGPWETFTAEINSNGTTSFRSSHGTYLSAQPDGRLLDNGPRVNQWEYFHVTLANNIQVSFKGAHNKYVVAESDNKTVQANRDAAGPWEKWTVISSKQQSAFRWTLGEVDR